MRKITGHTFYKYLKCPSWVYFDAHEAEAPHDPLLSRLLDEGLIPEKERLAVSDRPDFVEVVSEDQEEAFKQTLAFMREGRETIYQGVLIHGHWVGNPDLLAKVEGRSKFGDYYYVAADVKRHRQTRDLYKLQGCFYAELLWRLQGVKPVQGYVINPDKEIMSYLIEAFEVQFHLTLTEIEKIIAGEKPNHFLTAGCRQSPWLERCQLSSGECPDLSVLNRVWQEEVFALQQVGITTLPQLANLSLAALEKKAPKVRPDRLELLRLQAKAIVEDHHIVLQAPTFSDSPVELYFDIESDPLRDFDFLFGVLEVKNGRSSYHSFLAEKAEEEGEMWQKFITFITKYPKAPIYHYGWFELETFRRFAFRYELPEEVRLLIEGNMHDLLALIRPAVVFPLSFYSLKDLAAYTGFKWQSGVTSGVQAVRWFEEWLASGDKKVLEKILEYNKDDVKATRQLKEWVAKQFA